MRSLSRSANTVFAVSWLLKSRKLSKPQISLFFWSPIFSEALSCNWQYFYPSKNRNQRPEDRETRGPGDQRIQDQDHGTKGLEDQGSGGPRDQRTRGPEDHGTRGPEDQNRRKSPNEGEPNQGGAKPWKKKTMAHPKPSNPKS